MRPSPDANYRLAAGSRPEAKAPSAESAKAQIKRIIWDRKSSETTIVGYWRYVPLVAVSLAALTGLTFFVLVPNLTGFVFGYLAIYSVSFAVLAIINYKLVKSMNAHLSREAALRPLLIDVVRQHAMESDSAEAREAVTKMQRANLDASRRERPPNEMIAPMSALPIVGIAFGFAFLRSMMAARAEHDRNWQEFLSQIKVAEAKSGRELAIAVNQNAGKSNFLAFFAISLLCFPFLAYWYSDIERRTEFHLQEQWQGEDQLAKVVL